MVVNLPPITGNTELDQWTYDVTSELEDGVPTSGGGGGGDTPEPIPGDAGSRQWNARYLDVAYGIDANGTDFTRSFTSLFTNPATVLWVGYRNQESGTRETNNPAGFNWYELIIPTDRTMLRAYYKVIGGRRVSIAYATSLPEGFSLYLGLFLIDLDTVAAGARGPVGPSGLSVFLTTDDGTVFKNNAGPRKRITANLNFGGVVPTDEAYAGYSYAWLYENQVVCIDSNRNIIDDNGRPLLSTGDAGALVCTFGNPATSDQNTVSGVLRDVLVGPEDVPTTLRLGCRITNIPE